MITPDGLIRVWHIAPVSQIKIIAIRIVFFVLVVESVVFTANYYRSHSPVVKHVQEAGLEVARPTSPPTVQPLVFLTWYNTTCAQSMHPVSSPSTAHLPPCACVPDTLVGRMNMSEAVSKVPSVGEMELTFTHLQEGGAWRPSSCLARQRVALIVPFRDREEHLRIFLHHMHSLLSRQQLAYRILVIEQNSPTVFNKAALMNVGFLEARKLDAFDCFVFHDVDMLAEDDRNMYTCQPGAPRHIGAYVNNFNYALPYEALVGGATGFTAEQFIHVNGFTNEFYGWGGEDDDLEKRLRARNVTVLRYPSSIARYTMLKHGADKRNPYNMLGSMAWKYRPEHYPTDGVNNVRYKKVKVELRPLYTWINVALPWPKVKSLQEYIGQQDSSLSSSNSITVLPSLLAVVTLGNLIIVNVMWL